MEKKNSDPRGILRPTTTSKAAMTKNKLFFGFLMVAGIASNTAVVAFVPASRIARQQQHQSTTELCLGIPKFLLPKDEEEKQQQQQKSDGKTGSSTSGNEKKVGMKGLLQLITAGAGAPFLGDFEGVDEETGKFMFSLEANNLVDENGNSKQTSMPYFENGWVDEEDPGFSWPWEKKK